MAELDASHKLRRTESACSAVIVRVVHPTRGSLSWQEEALLFADGRILESEVVERSELLLGILQTEGDTVIPLLGADWRAWLTWRDLGSSLASPLPPQRLLELLQVRGRFAMAACYSVRVIMNDTALRGSNHGLAHISTTYTSFRYVGQTHLCTG
jgi:hypothetical protein